ncbi:hypothetical protein Tco_0882947 [Tanacetum coccineum]
MLPFIPNSLQPSNDLVPTYVNPYSQPNVGMTYGQPLSYFSHAQGGNPSLGGAPTYHSYRGHVSQAPMSNHGPTLNGSKYPSSALPNSYPFYTKPINLLPNTPAYPNYGPTDLFADPTMCVTPFVCWIEDYPLPDGLKMPSHIGSYDGKWDPENYLHLFKGVIRMQKQKFRSHFSQQKKFTKTHLAMHNIKQKNGESTRSFVTRYTDDKLHILGLHEEQRISGFIHGLKTRSLVRFLSTDLPTTYKGLMEKTYTWIEAKEVATNRALNDYRERFENFIKGSFWDNNKGKKKNRDRFSPCHGSNHGLLSNLSKSPREILATEKAAKAFEQPPCMVGSRRSRDMSKYCHIHEDHGHDTNQCRELRNQIEEAKGDKNIIPVDVHILMISRENHTSKRKSIEGLVDGLKEITFPPVPGSNSSSDPVIIKPSIRSLKVDYKVSLVGFSREHSWPLGEVPLEITIGESPFTRTEVPNFVIVRSNYPHNLLLGGTAMQRMGIVKEDKRSIKKPFRKLKRASSVVWAQKNRSSLMTGILITIKVEGKPFNTEHRLNEHKHIEPVKQKKRGLAPE